MMKAIAISDTHFNFPSYKDAARKLVDNIVESDAEVLVHGGDFSAGDFKESYDPWLDRLDKFQGKKIFVPGNHDVWCEALPEMRYAAVIDYFQSRGWHVLDSKPLRIGDTYFVGNMGWYDYSLFDPNAFKDATVSTLARTEVPWPELSHDDLSEKLFSINWNGNWKEMGWNDRNYTKWQISDVELAGRFNKKLKEDLSYGKGGKLVVVTHTVPFEELLAIRPDNPVWMLSNAYMGSRNMGRIISEAAKSYGKAVSICGHSHVPHHKRIGDVDAYLVSFATANPEPHVIEI